MKSRQIVDTRFDAVTMAPCVPTRSLFGLRIGIWRVHTRWPMSSTNTEDFCFSTDRRRYQRQPWISISPGGEDGQKFTPCKAAAHSLKVVVFIGSAGTGTLLADRQASLKGDKRTARMGHPHRPHADSMPFFIHHGARLNAKAEWKSTHQDDGSASPLVQNGGEGRIRGTYYLSAVPTLKITNLARADSIRPVVRLPC